MPRKTIEDGTAHTKKIIAALEGLFMMFHMVMLVAVLLIIISRLLPKSPPAA